MINFRMPAEPPDKTYILLNRRVFPWILLLFLYAVLVIYYSYTIAFPVISSDQNVQHIHEGSFLSSSKMHPRQLAQEGWKSVVLPDGLSINQSGHYQGWYSFALDGVAQHLIGRKLYLYFPKIADNIEVFVNDTWVGNGGDMHPPVHRNKNHPLLFVLDRQALLASGNKLYVHLIGQIPRGVYLGDFYVGNKAGLFQYYDINHLLRINLVSFITTILLSFGLFIGFLWLFRRKDTYYLFLSLGTFCWTLHDSNNFLRTPINHEVVWDALMPLSFGWSIVFLMLFLHRIEGHYKQNIERFIVLTMLVCSLPFLYLDQQWIWFYGYRIWYVIVALIGVHMVFFLFGQYKKYRKLTTLLMLLSGLCICIFGLHDLLVITGVTNKPALTLLHFAALPTILVIANILLLRFVASMQIMENYNKALKYEVELKEEEMIRSHEEIRQLQRTQILARERERIMRDIHDGIGGQLVGTLAAIDSPDITLQQVKGNLQVALQDLRLVIDSLDGDAQDISTILGTLRMRLGGLLQQANIKLIWDVRDLPQQEEFGPEKALSMMRIVQEAITNVIKHSGATELTVSAYPEVRDGREVVVVSVGDNGCGMVGDGVRGRGLCNMEVRAKRMGALFEIGSKNHQGLRVDLVL